MNVQFHKNYENTGLVKFGKSGTAEQGEKWEG